MRASTQRLLPQRAQAQTSNANVLHSSPAKVVNPRVPEALSTLCTKLLEKLPEDRYPDARALGEAVEAKLAREDASWSVP
jgi:hypothetical protein